MDVFLMIVALVLGTGLFVVINNIFEVHYWGFKGMASTWFSCVVAVGASMYMIGDWFMGLFN